MRDACATCTGGRGPVQKEWRSRGGQGILCERQTDACARVARNRTCTEMMLSKILIVAFSRTTEHGAAIGRSAAESAPVVPMRRDKMSANESITFTLP